MADCVVNARLMQAAVHRSWCGWQTVYNLDVLMSLLLNPLFLAVPSAAHPADY